MERRQREERWRIHRLHRSRLPECLAVALSVGLCAGCIDIGPEPTPTPEPQYNNTTDPTNQGAVYIGSAACRACHADVAETARLHGHGVALSTIQGEPPDYPAGADRAGVPETPAGFTWDEIPYVIGGSSRAANYVDEAGFVLTTQEEGAATLWNQALPAAGREAGMTAYVPVGGPPVPFDYSCFVCHATGAMPQDPDAPRFQDNRPGMAGTWAEAGVPCEACHGPGSNHPGNPTARDLYVDLTGAESCNACHNRPFDSMTGEILASDGFILNYAQYPELRASGGHANFTCMTCHDPHTSVTYAREAALVRDCTDCHADVNMARHDGAVFVRGDYTEVLSCESCHMPYATLAGAPAMADVAGTEGRMGDTRTHIFRIMTGVHDYRDMFTADFTEVVRDDAGRAAVTADFVCLRCHTDSAEGSNAFPLPLATAGQAAANLHLTGN